MEIDPDIEFRSNFDFEIGFQLALEQNGLGIKDIKNPSDKLKKIAMLQNSDSILHIEDLSEELQEWFIRQKRDNIFKIPKEKLDSKLKKKYRYFLSMGRTGIIS